MFVISSSLIHSVFLTIQGPCKSSVVLTFIKRHLPSTKLVEEIGTEMTFMLPTARGQAQAFDDLFNDLDRNKANLHIDQYGVSESTLEEVW